MGDTAMNIRETDGVHVCEAFRQILINSNPNIYVTYCVECYESKVLTRKLCKLSFEG